MIKHRHILCYDTKPFVPLFTRFTLDFENIQMDEYLTNTILGARHYLMKEDPKSLPRCRIILKMYEVYIYHYFISLVMKFLTIYGIETVPIVHLLTQLFLYFCRLYILDKLMSMGFYFLIGWLIVSTSDAASAALDAVVSFASSVIPFVREVKNH